MYLLSKGIIEVYKTIDKNEIKLWEVHAEWILWEMALFWKNEKRSASAKANKETVVIVFLSFSIKEIANKHPELVEKIKKIILEREAENKRTLDY
jgi:CRP-like cAMP-binding protein